MTAANLLADVRTQIDKVDQLIVTARRLVAECRAVDLSALEGRVLELCDSVGRLPREDAGPVIEAIAAVQRRLHALDEEISHQYEALTRQLDAGGRSAAIRAYSGDKA